MDNPRLIYTQLLDERRREVAAGEQRHHALGYLRLGIVLAGLALVWIALATRALSIVWAAVPIAAFFATIIMHEKLLGGLELRRRAVRFLERSLERLDGNWAGAGETGAQYVKPEHLYAQDLDL